MNRQFKRAKLISIILAVLITALGFGTMFLGVEIKSRVVEATDMKLPSAGISGLVEKYTKATGNSSVDYLTTTALMSGLEEYNEYYDKKGQIIGRTIIYTGDVEAFIYSKPTGYARIEKNEEEGVALGVVEKNAAVTLLGVKKDSWYKVVSNGILGYIKKDGFVTGKEAEKLDKDTYETLAYANFSNAYVYPEPDTDSEFIYCMPDGIGYQILGEQDGFTKIKIPNVEDGGWILNEDITIATTRRHANTIAVYVERNDRIAKGALVAQAIKDQEISEELAAELEAALAAERRRAYEKAMENWDGGVTGQAIADFARQFVGWLPYSHGGTSLVDGADCSGFTQAIYREFGFEIPRTTRGQMYDGGGIEVPLDSIVPGDIIYYGSHVAIYVGDNTIIHEPVPGQCCRYDSMNIMHVYGAVRYAY